MWFLLLFHRSARESYGDDAIGYVQIKREQGVCTIKCKICPEHKVRSKAYNVTLILNEKENEVISCQCHDCAASAGGCKHSVAFLMWVHRRTEEPASTSVECYWKKPTLSRVGTTIKYITVEQMCEKAVPHRPGSSELYNEFIAEAKSNNISHCELLKFQHDFKHKDVMLYSLHCFLMNQSEETSADVDKFIEVMKTIVTEAEISAIEEATRKQNKSRLWYEMRYGRVTASKAYEVSVCRTPEGSLIATAMGAKIPDTLAMKRGRTLEKAVRMRVASILNKKISICGVYICHEHPMIAASPDGLTKDAVIEIKCPTQAKTKDRYIKNGVIMEKFNAQVQLQMYATGMRKCYFCVADSKFEENKKVDILLLHYDSAYTHNLLEKLVTFWKNNIYPILYRSTRVTD